MSELVDILNAYAYSIANNATYSKEERLRRIRSSFSLGLDIAKIYNDKEAIDYFERLSPLFRDLCKNEEEVEKTKDQDRTELRHGDFVKYGIPSGSVYSLAKRLGIQVSKRDNANLYSLTNEQYRLINEYIGKKKFGKKKSKRAK